MQIKTIGIAGAGIMGRVLAWQCLRAGFNVTLFDKSAIEQGDAAAYTAAGMLSPYCEVESAEPLVFELGMQSLSLWSALATELNEDIGFQQQGSIIVAHKNDYADYQHFNHLVHDKITPTQDQLKQLNHAQLALLEPELADRFNQATYLPEEAWLCPSKTMSVLAKQLLANNVEWHQHCDVISITERTICSTEKDYHFDCVIDSRGLGAKKDWPELRGVRGELICLQAPDVNIKRLVRLMHPRYPLYLVPKGYDDLYIIGATQIESSDTGPISVRSSLELLSAAYSLHAGFAEARIVDTRTNCRPGLNDNLPQINCSDGIIRVNGLFRHGFLLSPVLGKEIIHRLQNPHYESHFTSLIQQVA